ncbi:hypothetical protein CC77DRAFT_677663 [Alternaria alternata]|jgi:hypothetical protein|uniref:Uncharacterized protein n=1 Tax=Alternaria alternata TaxID=5599 RepID=A0A177DT33_ALTAL|nr:hypothetical protein CC77DRAFT_677663 [Alternaria alternata]OAG22924.1 hypothetical protein CC77DRAFT_677663 [Alternaria alternata]
MSVPVVIMCSCLQKKKALVRALRYKSAITIAFILTAGFLMSLEMEVRTIVNMYQNLEMYSM